MNEYFAVKRPCTFAKFTPQGKLILTGLSGRNCKSFHVQLYKMETFLHKDPVFKQLENFAGPLMKEKTSRKRMILHCNQKMKICVSGKDQNSYSLIWNFLMMLVRQKGSCVGSDITNLLLEDQPVSKPSSIRANTECLNRSSKIISQEESVDKFKEYILYGNKLGAIEYAMKSSLWGHALFLASQMDQETHNIVLKRFANSIASTDPLQTLYQLMCNNQPTIATDPKNEVWKDWRSHLAMIVSNFNDRHQLATASISALADSLSKANYLYSAHFCDLVIKDFGSYRQHSNKLILIGSSQHLPFKRFATLDATQWTEVYEYAVTLNGSEYLTHFMPYKLLYASMLLDYGFSVEAMHYFKIIAENCQDMNLIKIVHSLTEPLRSINVFLEVKEDVDWLNTLNKTLESSLLCSSYIDYRCQKKGPLVEECLSPISTNNCTSSSVSTLDGKDYFNPYRPIQKISENKQNAHCNRSTACFEAKQNISKLSTPHKDQSKHFYEGIQQTPMPKVGSQVIKVQRSSTLKRSNKKSSNQANVNNQKSFYQEAAHNKSSNWFGGTIDRLRQKVCRQMIETDCNNSEVVWNQSKNENINGNNFNCDLPKDKTKASSNHDSRNSSKSKLSYASPMAQKSQLNIWMPHQTSEVPLMIPEIVVSRPRMIPSTKFNTKQSGRATEIGNYGYRDPFTMNQGSLEKIPNKCKNKQTPSKTEKALHTTQSVPVFENSQMAKLPPFSKSEEQTKNVYERPKLKMSC